MLKEGGIRMPMISPGSLEVSIRFGLKKSEKDAA
jgi:hypothetical protein